MPFELLSGLIVMYSAHFARAGPAQRVTPFPTVLPIYARPF